MGVKCLIWPLSVHYLIWQGRDISCLCLIGWLCCSAWRLRFNPCAAELFFWDTEASVVAPSSPFFSCFCATNATPFVEWRRSGGRDACGAQNLSARNASFTQEEEGGGILPGSNYVAINLGDWKGVTATAHCTHTHWWCGLCCWI